MYMSQKPEFRSDCNYVRSFITSRDFPPLFKAPKVLDKGRSNIFDSRTWLHKLKESNNFS